MLGLIAAHFVTLDNFNREFRFRFELKRINFKVSSREFIYEILCIDGQAPYGAFI